MPIRIKTFLAGWLALGWLAFSPAAQNNHFYITDVGKGPVPEPPFTAQQIETARAAKDSRPVQDDPEGHWGTPTEGFQLSLRFTKESFTNGEPVTATVILRNVTDKPLTYPYEYAADESEIRFLLLRGDQRVYGKYDPPPGAAFLEKVTAARKDHGWTRVSPPGTQRKFFVDLSSTYPLTTNGQYVACAKRIVRKLGSTEEAQVSSGKAAFSITGPSSAAARPR